MMFGDKDENKKELLKKFEEFKKKFFSSFVGTCSEQNVGPVMEAISSKLLGSRTLLLVPNASIDKDHKFRIEIIMNVRFAEQLQSSYQLDFFALERFMRDFSQATFDLEVKSFVMGLHALSELRERIADLETQVSAMAKELRRARKAPTESYLGKVR